MCDTLRWTVHLEGGPKRAYHASVAVAHKVYSFGGYCYRETDYLGQIDVLVFNTVSLRWVKLPPATAGRGDSPLEVPGMRDGHSAVLMDGVIYIWGGTIFTKVYSDVLYGFDVDAHAHGWFKPKVSGAVPEARRDHSACVLGRVMYVYGGFSKLTGYINDVYKLDTTTSVWALINARGTLALVSERHSATIIGKKMFVFGGKGDQVEDHYSNIRVFDTVTDCWLSTPSAHLLPEGREDHSAFSHDGELYIFGGDNLERTFNDMWKFNPETFSWKKVKPKGKGPSWMTVMCCCAVGDHVVFFGGYRLTPVPIEDLEDEDYVEVSDLHILDLSPCLKTLCKLAVLQYGLGQSSLPHDIRWELAAMTTNDKT